MVRKARDWSAAHRAEMTLSLRITVAGLIALALGELLGVKQVYWAVLTAVIVMQANVGGSLKATIDRLAGTVSEPSGARCSGQRSRIRVRSQLPAYWRRHCFRSPRWSRGGRATGSPRSP